MGEIAPNAVLCGWDGWDGWDGWAIVKDIEKAIVKDIEKAIAGYSQGYRKGDCWL